MKSTSHFCFIVFRMQFKIKLLALMNIYSNHSSYFQIFNSSNKFHSEGMCRANSQFHAWTKEILSRRRQTCLETGLEHIRWDGDGPVEDSGHPPSKQDAGNAELIVAAGQNQRAQSCFFTQNQQTWSVVTLFTFSPAVWGGSSATRKRWSTFHWLARLSCKHGMWRYFSCSNVNNAMPEILGNAP